MRRMLPFYVVYLIIITMVVTGVSFSKYGTIVDETDAARVARPVLDYVPISATFKGTPIGELSGGMTFNDVQPGDELIFHFEIRNYKNENLNEVLLKYKIEISIEPEGELPLLSTLTPDDSYAAAGGGWIFLGMGSPVSHLYTLTIVWDSGTTGSEYSEKEQSIKITINAEQID